MTLGDGLEIVDSSAFSSCAKLSSITFGTSLREVGSCAFGDINASYDTNTKWINNQSDGPVYAGTVFYGFRNSHLLSNKITGSFTIRDGTKGIAISLFSNKRSLPA